MIFIIYAPQFLRKIRQKHKTIALTHGIWYELCAKDAQVKLKEGKRKKGYLNKSVDYFANIC